MYLILYHLGGLPKQAGIIKDHFKRCNLLHAVLEGYTAKERGKKPIKSESVFGIHIPSNSIAVVILKL